MHDGLHIPCPVHLRHFRDGYPLCWPQDREGEFTAAADEALVDCPECRSILADPGVSA